MSGRGSKDFCVWLFWLTTTMVTLLGACSHWYSVNTDSISSNDYVDNTGVTLLILVLFSIAFLANIINTIGIFLQFSNLNRSEGLFKEHIDNLRRVAEKKLSVDQDFSLSLIENRLLRKESWVQLFANLLVTLGMIGTVLGLTVAMRGLSEAMDSIKNSLSSDISVPPDSVNPVVGLSSALSGMSSAFITTLAGAVLGGLFLKLLSHATTNLIEDLLDNMRYKAELEVIPSIQKQIWERDLRDLSTAYTNLRSFMNTSHEIDSQLRKYTNGMSNASSQLEILVKNLSERVSYYTNQSSQAASQTKMANSLLQIEVISKQTGSLIKRLNFLVGILVGILIIAVSVFVYFSVVR